jgi:hypothetical protein
MAATMNGRVHENRNENLHGGKKFKKSLPADKTPAQGVGQLGARQRISSGGSWFQP